MSKDWFDTLTDRRGSGSYKWDEDADGVIPMWVADMDFQTAPCIIDALRRRLNHGIFGYTLVGQDYYDAVTGWFARRHGWNFTRDEIIYTSGVVPAVSAIIKALTSPGDKVIVQTPGYNCFFSSIRNNGCEASCNRLVWHQDGYRMDFDDLEQRMSDNRTNVMILCNPHNPVGRVWSRNELERVAELAARYNVTVVSDEIHCELVYGPNKYIPYGSLSEDVARASVSCVSPSKAFNIAGLQIANIVTADSDKLRRIDRAINDNEVCDVNPFGVAATIAAYGDGEEWLAELIDYLWQNYLILDAFFRTKFPQMKVTPLEGTYLAWVDCSATGLSGDDLTDLLTQEARVRLNAGSMYGPGGEHFVRVNLACPRARLEEALRRISPVLQRIFN